MVKLSVRIRATIPAVRMPDISAIVKSVVELLNRDQQRLCQDE